MRRRELLFGGVALTLVGGAYPALAQSAAEGHALRFLSDLMQVASGGQTGTVMQYLRPQIDADYVFARAFEGVSIGEGHRQRLAELMFAFISREAILVADYATGAQLRANGSQRVSEGTRVNLAYRDQAGPYPLHVLLTDNPQSAGYLVRDFGSDQQSSVVSKLSYAAQSLQGVTSDATIWIRSFEEVLAGA